MRRIPRLIPLLIVALLLAALPVQATLAQQPPVYAAWPVSIPPPLCPGDQVAISVMIMDITRGMPVTGQPMHVFQSDPTAGRLEPNFKLVINGMADFVYIANGDAQGRTVTDVLTFTIGGYPTGLAIPVTVYGACDYRLDLLIEQHEHEDSFYMDIVVSGELVLKRVTNQAHGEGTDDVYFNMSDLGENLACFLDPAIQGSGAFQSDATFSRVSPGVETISFDLIFDSVPLNGSKLDCTDLTGQWDVNVNLPFPAGSWDQDEMGLQGLTTVLTNGYGSVPVSYDEMHGRVTIRREARP